MGLIRNSILSFFMTVFSFSFYTNIGMSITIKVLGDSSAIGVATAWNSLITILIGLVFGYVCRAFKRFTLASSLLIQAIAFAILVAAPSLGVITVGGIDWFGVVWSYKEGELAPVPDSSVPPICLNICGWRETVIFPDMEAWDWGEAEVCRQELLEAHGIWE